MFKINYNSKFSEGLNEEKKSHRADIHSFHRYYGKLIPAIPSYFIKEFTKKDDIVFDPFSGSGTVAVEAKRLKRNFVGVEINPLSVEIARAKTYDLKTEILNRINNELVNMIENDKSKVKENEKPYIMNRDHWFKEFVQEDLIRIKKDIDKYFEENKNYSIEYKKFYLLTLSAIIKNVSNADTRHVFPGFSKRMHQLEEEGKIHTDVKASFKRAIKARSKSYSIYENNKNYTDILEGDSTEINLDKYKNKVDLIVTNPPYISSVRYIETLKLEMYWMEVIKTLEEYNNLAHEMIGNDKLRKEEYKDIELTNYQEINDLIELGVNTKYESSHIEEDERVSGKRFVITGSFDFITRDEIKRMGGCRNLW